MGENNNIISLSELQNIIKQSIESSVKARWVSCDITDLKVNGNGHCYLEITEKAAGKGAIPKAKATAIIWRNTFQMVDNYFFKETGERLRGGIKVLLYVEANYHELYGLSLVVRNIDPTYTLGDSERLKRETIEQLRKDGIIDMNKDIEMPLVIKRVAVISSATAAGYDDFINQIANNPFGYSFKIELFPAFVQGDGAESSIVAALDAINDVSDSYDVVVVIRGGGSQSDMSCFNSYLLCSYMAQFPLPILTGIGHNKDMSVADMVAHTSLKTPTAVANFIIDSVRFFDERLGELKELLLGGYNLFLEREKRKFDRLSQQLQLSVNSFVNGERVRCEKLFSQLHYGAKRVIDREGQRLTVVENLLNSNNPQRILDMGYSIMVLDGKAVRSVKDVKGGERVDILLGDGTISAVVDTY